MRWPLGLAVGAIGLWIYLLIGTVVLTITAPDGRAKRAAVVSWCVLAETAAFALLDQFVWFGYWTPDKPVWLFHAVWGCQTAVVIVFAMLYGPVIGCWPSLLLRKGEARRRYIDRVRLFTFGTGARRAWEETREAISATGAERAEKLRHIVRKLAVGLALAVPLVVLWEFVGLLIGAGFSFLAVGYAATVLTPLCILLFLASRLLARSA